MAQVIFSLFYNSRLLLQKKFIFIAAERLDIWDANKGKSSPGGETRKKTPEGRKCCFFFPPQLPFKATSKVSIFSPFSPRRLSASVPPLRSVSATFARVGTGSSQSNFKTLWLADVAAVDVDVVVVAAAASRARTETHERSRIFEELFWTTC